MLKPLVWSANRLKRFFPAWGYFMPWFLAKEAGVIPASDYCFRNTGGEGPIFPPGRNNNGTLVH